jgi:hypothetical protein
MPSKSRVDYNPILLLFAMVRVVKVRQNQRVSTASAELIILTFVYLTRLGEYSGFGVLRNTWVAVLNQCESVA